MEKPVSQILGEDRANTILQLPTASLIVDSQLIAWVVMYREDKPLNVIDLAFIEDLNKIVTEIERLISSKQVRVVVFYSQKKGNFVAGADIKGFYPVTDIKDATEVSRVGQRLMDKISNLKAPTLSAVNGAALGGGLELALACSYRVAAKSRGTQLGLPEVKLGVIPGAGGTVRLPKIIGLQQALQIILPGAAVNAEKAKRLGLVDKLIDSEDRFQDENRFFHEVRAYAGTLVDKPSKRTYTPSKTTQDKILNETWIGKKIVGRMAYNNLNKTTKGKYPAPYKALESTITSTKTNTTKALEFEANAFGQLLVSPEAKNLMSIFFLTTQAKQVGSKTNNAPVIPVKKVGVIGAGVMGSGIAQIFGFRDFGVYMKDIKPEFVEKGMDTINKLFMKLVQSNKMSKADAQKKLDRIKGGTDNAGFADCEVIVEAAVEQMPLKKKILQECEQVMPENAIFATNTSSLSVTELATVSKRPQNVVGMHFFNPVHRMPLVEVIRGKHTSDMAVATIYNLALKLGKIPVIVNDGPGFLVNRVLGIYMCEAGRLLAEGGHILFIDKTITDFGMPMGPFRLIDTVGLDVAMHVGHNLAELGSRFSQPTSFGRMVSAGYLGQKSGKGFYAYKDGKSTGLEPSLEHLLSELRRNTSSYSQPASAADIVDRCILLMVNEAAYILEEGICESPEDVDLAMIMGTGFAPFRGGLLAYADSRGIKNIVDRLNQLTNQLGPRFKPANLLVEMARDNKRFFPNRPQVPYVERRGPPPCKL
eukprot:GEZU01017684.1.p1 GENE.GEZU01017684.1~~GEZU01017684.1.p1  ORF type:complete len:761 (-),score=255.57 GEZU01017684.1:173-2455(-)